MTRFLLAARLLAVAALLAPIHHACAQEGMAGEAAYAPFARPIQEAIEQNDIARLTALTAAAYNASANERRAAAHAAAMAAGEAAYAPFARPIQEAIEQNDIARLTALTAVAFRASAYAVSMATCMAFATNPAACERIYGMTGSNK